MFQNFLTLVFPKRKTGMVTHIRLYLLLFGANLEKKEVWKILEFLENICSHKLEQLLNSAL